MYSLAFYVVEYAGILACAVFIHKYVFNRKRKYDAGSLYLSVLAATYIWIVTACMHLFGIGVGLIGGLAGGAVAVVALDAAVGALYNAGY